MQANTPEELSKILKNTPQIPDLKLKTDLSNPIKKKRAKRPGEGRPAVKVSDLPKDWKEIVFRLSAQGYSQDMIRLELCTTGKKFCMDTFYELKKRDVEFSDTIKESRALSRAWWERQGTKNLKHSRNTVFETALWFINMKNQFGWKDKSEVDQTVTDATAEKYRKLTDAELIERIDNLTRQAVSS